MRFKFTSRKSFALRNSYYRELIDVSWMSNNYKGIDFDVKDYGPLFRAGLDPNPYFDSDWYVSTNQDVETSGLDPLFHYASFGESEGRKPNPLFDPNHYLIKHPELKEQQGTLLAHFIKNGFGPSSLVTEVDNNSTFEDAKRMSLQRRGDLQTNPHVKKIGVVIPVFNNWMMTERCIRAIEKTNDYEFLQIYLFNDGSTDETMHEIKRYPEVITINTPSKLGYLKTCNFAFSHLADFEYLFLLRNTTEPVDGFLINALETMEARKDCSIVGSRLFFSDGRLQASGGIVSRFGDAIQFGESDGSHAKLYQISRKVDYAPLVAGLIRNSDFIEVGGFDEDYGVGGYEDIDLAFKMKSIGKTIYVSSDSIVINYGSQFKKEGSFPFGSQVDHSNKIKFKEKWNDVLMEGY
jgi:GT2 family glycosyltransferase